MNSLEAKLQQDLVVAMKNKNEIQLSSIRMVKTAIQIEKTNETYHELSDEDILKIIRKRVKDCAESAVMYAQANRLDLADKENLEAKFLTEAYLPAQLSESDVRTAVEGIMNDVGKNMGAIMKALKEKYPNQVDGKVASGIIKEILAQ